MTAKSPKLRVAQVKAFQAQIWTFYGHSGRYSLLWRRTHDPYCILVSEIMLQQTQVARVEKKYPEFLRAFPTIRALAKASTADILRVWQGMGYNRRALALKKIAEIIVHEHKGKVPNDPELLEKLPGIGPYTARAITTFAFNAPHVFIETNIRRVYIHHFFSNLLDTECPVKISDTEIVPLIETTLDHNDPREWYYALMDYGAQLPKQVKNPNQKSAHYAKQSAFKGSNREARGMILKLLAQHVTLTKVSLAKDVAGEKLTPNLAALIHEGFIKKVGRKFILV